MRAKINFIERIKQVAHNVFWYIKLTWNFSFLQKKYVIYFALLFSDIKMYKFYKRILMRTMKCVRKFANRRNFCWQLLLFRRMLTTIFPFCLVMERFIFIHSSWKLLTNSWVSKARKQNKNKPQANKSVLAKLRTWLCAVVHANNNLFCKYIYK